VAETTISVPITEAVSVRFPVQKSGHDELFVHNLGRNDKVKESMIYGHLNLPDYRYAPPVPPLRTTEAAGTGSCFLRSDCSRNRYCWAKPVSGNEKNQTGKKNV
jgi:hypothetical protein